MHSIEGRLVLSPTDLTGFLACEHLVQLELAADRGELTRPTRDDPELDLLRRKGEAHETAFLERLRQERGSLVEIADPDETLAGLKAAEAETLEAMRAGAHVIYQAAFFDGRWRGRADYLLRVEAPSELGSWSYEVADAKLARSVKVAALLQMCDYSLHVARLQGRPPKFMHVILGDQSQVSHLVADFDAYHRAARRRLEQTVDGAPLITYPDPVDHCRLCRWLDRCSAQRRADDHLCLVAGMRRDHTRRLVDAGIKTLAELAIAPEQPVADIGDSTWERLRDQARLQMRERTTGEPTYELRTVDGDGTGLGLSALPPPSPGDLFFDMEGDMFVEDGGLEYLFGITEVVDGRPKYHAFWAHDRTEEKIAFEAVVDFVMARLERHPDMHVYHYANYEPSAMKKLMGRHATRVEEVDQLLRGGVFVDLYQVVRQGVRVSRESYSLKSLEVFYMPRRDDAIVDAAASIVAYERWIETVDDALLQSLEEYNERDCESTLLLRDWLEARRVELAEQAGRELPRPLPQEGKPSEALAEVLAETRGLVEALTVQASGDRGLRGEEARGQWLLGQLLDWHRREEKSAWWAFHERRAKTDDELVEDAEAIGRIVHTGALRTEKKSTVHRYTFDPTQEHKLDKGDEPCDPRTGRVCGTIVDIDNDAGTLELRRGPTLTEVDHPSSLIPPKPFDTTPMRDALRRIAAWVIEHDVGAPGRYRAARDLLMRRAPRSRNYRDPGPLVDQHGDEVHAARRLAVDLDDSCLAIQGPPGCGKTYTGAEIIVEMVARGWRVGICATTHRAICNLLKELGEAAARHGVPVRALQKCAPEQACGLPEVGCAERNADVEAALAAGEVDVVAGTSWLFGDQRLDGVLDAVVIDEAGQMSLANALAVCAAARNLILLGDPQQLAQPSQGTHPEGAGASALEHLLDGHDTIPPDRGVFLGTTRRMHPDVSQFISAAFYEGRLHSHPDCSRQRVDGAGDLSGTGLRLVPVFHVGNRTWSPEELDEVRALVHRLLGGTWTDSSGTTHPLSLSEVLVVAPYNAQVKRLRDRLPEGARVGTVDKFQGQQAAVTIYAMATSSAEDIPRNVEFLFSRNRLNVAVSRARALSIVVCSPELFRVRCRTPEQLRLVSALCRYAEMAAVGTPALA